MSEPGPGLFCYDLVSVIKWSKGKEQIDCLTESAPWPYNYAVRIADVSHVPIYLLKMS